MGEEDFQDGDEEEDEGEEGMDSSLDTRAPGVCLVYFNFYLHFFPFLILELSYTRITSSKSFYHNRAKKYKSIFDTFYLYFNF